MEDQTLESFVEERVAQLQAISQRRNALLRQMFHMVQKRQNVASVIKLQDEEGDEELAVFLDKFDLTKNPDTGSIDYFVQDHLVVSTPSPGPVVPSTRPSPTPSSPQHSEPPAPETAEPPTPETAEPPTPEIAEPPTPEIAELPTPETAQQPLPEPPVQDLHHHWNRMTNSISLARLQSLSTPRFGLPSEIVHVVDAPAPESITVVNGDDSAEAKPITPSNGDTTDEEDLVQIVRPLEIVDPEVPIMVEDEMPKGQHEASPSSNEDPIHVQDVEATEDDVALPEADEPPPVEKDMDMVVEDDLFSAHDDLTPPPTTEPELEPEPEPEPVTDTLGPSTIKSLDDSEQLEVGASEDVMMHDDLPGPVEEAKDQLEVHTDRPTETARPETPLSEAESMVIDEPDNEDVQAEQTLGQVVAPAVFDSRVVDIAEYDTRESTPQPVVTLAAPTAPVFLRQAPPPLPAPPELTTPSQSRHSFLPTYTLPALKSLPAEFSRKSKPAKQQRKHKEREKSGGDKAKDKDDWAPLGISRWGATIRANPVHVKVSRAPKCLNSREWGVAMTELRLMRAFEQIESLKDAGRWSFRQPKKQRGIGGVTKTHWDYVMDEMKWMRTDFREERKWKLALAYNLSTAVLEWHSFSTHAERVAKGICVGWKPPRADLIPEQLMVDEDILPLEQPSMDVEDKEDKPAPSLSSARPTSLVDYGSDDDDDDEQEKQSVMDALEPSSALEEALDIAEKGPDTAAADSGFRDVEFKRGEDSEPPSAMSDATSKMDVDEEADAEAGKPDAEDKNSEEPTKPVELKDSSGDPMLSQADSIASMGESGVSVAPGAKAPAQANIYGPLREHLAYSDSTKLFLDLNDFDHVVMNASADELSADPAFPPTDLSEIFPDLPPLNMLDVAPPTVNTAEGKTKKSEKRADRDDPNKRIEDTMYTKLFPIGKFMYTKPTLIGPLQPAKRWKNGRWLNADDCPASDSDTPSTKPQDSLSDLFNPKFANSPKSLEQQLKEKEAKEAPRRVVHMWTPVDDNLLKSLADKYPNNWALIAECYNSARLTISTDKRSARDCQERWKERWAQEPPPKSQEATPDEPPPTPSSAVPPSMPPTPSMTTRGIKRLASASVSGPPPAASGSDAKKRRRHQFMQETIRKAGKKRAEAAQKALANQRKQPAVHETHAQYARLPKYSPAELSRMKAEKDFKDQQDLAQARRRHEELTRAAQGQRVPAGPQAQAQAQAAQQGQQGQQGQGAAAQTQAAQAQAHAQAAQQAQPGQAVPGQQQQQPQQVPASTQQTPSTQPQPQSAAQTAQMLQMQAMQAVQQQRAAAARNQVNISQQQVPQPQQQQQQQHPQQQQQQRIASPMTGVNPRLPMTPHQQILMQQQQARLAHGLLIQQQQNLQAQQAAAAASAAHANNVGVRAGTSSPRPPGGGISRGCARERGCTRAGAEQLQMVLQQHMQQAQLAQQQQQQQQQQQHQGHGG
ncbi:hypothetical protein MSAN_01273800 [Mycena sanguinolenta]|uniref:Vacuolar import and degradation protein 21 n=1 Tax=Mycena sanguinolenta TaxID=230812 RepID=A0A8H6YJB4_9AGAR|nr:hypothetical protein MSAN_01273800 [Mycena sanguinolenta]